MSEYINKDDLLKLIHEKGIYPAYFVKMVEKMPKVEIVRCKDCKHWVQTMCRNWIDWLPTDANDFCSDGEPKEV